MWSPAGSEILVWPDPLFSASLLADGTSLMSVPVDGGEPAEIVSQMLLHRSFLGWSPDGQRLALVDGGRRETWVNKGIAVATVAGPPQRLSESDRSDLFPAWSPDGRWIAFTEGPAESEAASGSSPQATMARRRIWLSSPDGLSKQPLTGDPAYRDERPLWSADGQHILFARLLDDQVQLWLMRADGSEQRLVVGSLDVGPAKSQGASAWFGFYGYLAWDRLYDWWPG